MLLPDRTTAKSPRQDLLGVWPQLFRVGQHPFLTVLFAIQALLSAGVSMLMAL